MHIIEDLVHVAELDLISATTNVDGARGPLSNATALAGDAVEVVVALVGIEKEVTFGVPRNRCVIILNDLLETQGLVGGVG
jgi:hypothetical protein